MLRLKTQSRLQMGNGLLQPSLVMTGDAEIAESIRISRGQGQRRLITGDGAIEIAFLLQDNPKVTMHHRQIRAPGQGGAIGENRIITPALMIKLQPPFKFGKGTILPHPFRRAEGQSVAISRD